MTKPECAVCKKSRMDGLIRDPEKKYNYICATRLLQERAKLKKALKDIKKEKCRYCGHDWRKSE